MNLNKKIYVRTTLTVTHTYKSIENPEITVQIISLNKNLTKTWPN